MVASGLLVASDREFAWISDIVMKCEQRTSRSSDVAVPAPGTAYLADETVYLLRLLEAGSRERVTLAARQNLEPCRPCGREVGFLHE